MSMYSKFKTNDNLEQNGVILDYGPFRITIARAGGTNKKFAKIMEAKAKPYRRAIATETLDEKVATNMLYEAFAEGIILNWEVLKTGEKDEKGKKLPDSHVSGIEGPDGEMMQFTQENVITTFENLPELFLEIKSQAESSALFKEDDVKEDSKNS